MHTSPESTGTTLLDDFACRRSTLPAPFLFHLLLFKLEGCRDLEWSVPWVCNGRVTDEPQPLGVGDGAADLLRDGDREVAVFLPHDDRRSAVRRASS